MTTAGIDLRHSFETALQNLGLSPGAAHALWVPLPMVLMVIAATLGSDGHDLAGAKNLGSSPTADWPQHGRALRGC
jgi:hypothetical protein